MPSAHLRLSLRRVCSCWTWALAQPPSAPAALERTPLCPDGAGKEEGLREQGSLGTSRSRADTPPSLASVEETTEASKSETGVNDAPCSPQAQRRGEEEEAPISIETNMRCPVRTGLSEPSDGVSGCIRVVSTQSGDQPSTNERSSCRVTARITPRAEKHLKKQLGNQHIFSSLVLLRSNPSELQSFWVPGSAGKKGKESGQGQVWLSVNKEEKSVAQMDATSAGIGRCWKAQESKPAPVAEKSRCSVMSVCARRFRSLSSRPTTT